MPLTHLQAVIWAKVVASAFDVKEHVAADAKRGERAQARACVIECAIAERIIDGVRLDCDEQRGHRAQHPSHRVWPPCLRVACLPASFVFVVCVTKPRLSDLQSSLHVM